MPSLHLTTPGLRVRLEGARVMILRPSEHDQETAPELAVHLHEIERVFAGEKTAISLATLSEFGAYDISEPKRLAKIARYCEDHGVRVQYSVFECRLETTHFEDFWLGLEELIDPETDRIVAYRVCSSCARAILTAGTMEHTAPAIAYVF